MASDNWLADAGVFRMFMDFPLPLVACPADGAEPVPNGRFIELFGSAGLKLLDPGKMQDAVRRDWLALRMPDLGGSMLDVKVRAQATPNGNLLVIEESVPSVDMQAIAELHGRIAELERLSALDRLTGAWNRAHLDRVVEAEIARSLRLRQPVSLLLMDIDHFKSVNDTHGHAAGDEVLKMLVEVVRYTVRASDLVFRWGGEEFVVLSPATDFRRAGIIAEKLRKTVASQSFPRAGRVTISLGVAEHIAVETAGAWFERVDAQLYKAKEGGRNRVSVDERGSSADWARSDGGGALHLDWRDDYESGNDLIDEQHRGLFDLGNRLIDAAGSPTGSTATVLAAMDELIAHAERHFHDEEAILHELHFDGVVDHAHSHAALLRKARELRAGVLQGAVTFGGVVDFLARDLVARHLFMADRQYYPLTRGSQNGSSA